MIASAAELMAGTVEWVVRRIVVPVTSVIPALVEHGVLLAIFAALWLGFGAAFVTDPAALARTWGAIGQMPLPAQAIAWLLFLPLAGLWTWSTDWALAVRLVVIVGIAGWNLLVFLPRRPAAGQVSVGS